MWFPVLCVLLSRTPLYPVGSPPLLPWAVGTGVPDLHADTCLPFLPCFSLFPDFPGPSFPTSVPIYSPGTFRLSLELRSGIRASTSQTEFGSGRSPQTSQLGVCRVQCQPPHALEGSQECRLFSPSADLLSQIPVWGGRSGLSAACWSGSPPALEPQRQLTRGTYWAVTVWNGPLPPPGCSLRSEAICFICAFTVLSNFVTVSHMCLTRQTDRQGFLRKGLGLDTDFEVQCACKGSKLFQVASTDQGNDLQKQEKRVLIISDVDI